MVARAKMIPIEKANRVARQDFGSFAFLRSPCATVPRRRAVFRESPEARHG